MHPVRSSFELPEGQSNPYLHYDEFLRYVLAPTIEHTLLHVFSLQGEQESGRRGRRRRVSWVGTAVLFFSVCLFLWVQVAVPQDTQSRGRSTRS